MSLRTARVFVNWYDMGFPSKRHKLSNDRPCNVVFLLGWMECRSRHLSTIGTFYADKSFAIIRYYPCAVTFASPNAEVTLKKHASHMVDVLRLNNLDKNPIYFHCFSLTGAIMYHLIRRQFDLPVAGIVFDSCPMLVDETFLPERGFKKVLSNLIYFLTFMPADDSYQRMVANACLTLKNRSGSCPELFLYSKGDKVVDYRRIEGFMDERNKIGVITDSLVWEDSDHVDHLHRHPDQYFLKLEDFVATCSNIFYTSVYPATGQQKNGKVTENLISRL